MLFTDHKDFFKVEWEPWEPNEWQLYTSVWSSHFLICITEMLYEDYDIIIYVNDENKLDMSWFHTLEKAKNFAYGFLMWFECQRNLVLENI